MRGETSVINGRITSLLLLLLLVISCFSEERSMIDRCCSGTGAELWSGPMLGAIEVKWQNIDLRDGRLKKHTWARSYTLPSSIVTITYYKTRQPHMLLHVHVRQVHPTTQSTNTQKLHHEGLLVSNHPRLYSIISINSNHIKWQDESLHVDMSSDMSYEHNEKWLFEFTSGTDC